MKKIAIAQINSITGALSENKNHIETFIEQAIQKNVEVLIFPKNIILGINAKDLQYDNG